MLKSCDFANVQEQVKMMKFEYIFTFALKNQRVSHTITIDRLLLIFKSV